MPPDADARSAREIPAAPASDRPILDAGSPCPSCGSPMVRLWRRTICRACGYFEGCKD